MASSSPLTSMRRILSEWCFGGSPLVLAWHSVGDDEHVGYFDASDIARGRSSHCSLDVFRSQIEFVGKHRRFVPYDELVQLMKSGTGVRGLAAVTFDDAYSSLSGGCLDWLWDRGIPAVLFVNSALVDRRELRHFDALRRLISTHPEELDEISGPGEPSRILDQCLLSRAGWQAAEDLLHRFFERTGMAAAELAGSERLHMDWDGLRSVVGKGFEIGNHGTRHLNLALAADSELDAEIHGGQQEIRTHLGVDCRHYAYGFGGRDQITDAAIDLVLETHESIASACGGRWTGSDRVIPRMPMISTGVAADLVGWIYPKRYWLGG